jgi:hypothetical protein
MLRWRLCWRCAGILFLRVAGVLTSIALLLSLAMRQRHCPCSAGIFALILLALLIVAHPCHHQHRKWVSSQ